MHVVVLREEMPCPSYVLGIINSSLLNWYYQTLNPEVGEALAEVKRANVAKLPISLPDLSNPSERADHDELVALVDKMLALQSQSEGARTSHGTARKQRDIRMLDAKIDEAVYRIYGLSGEEISIINGSAP
ncbi:MAG: hypothetical protein JRG67_09910 [Deltaproteobacteria bacterium]|nr:hypothetical protein [Deltaproteobacteria bacterium]